MPADISQGNWQEVDGNNNQAAPNGFPEGMFPSGLNDSARQLMGATKRFWDRINGTVKATTVGNDYTYAPAVAAPALADGEVYCFRIDTANTGPARLNVGVGGFQQITKPYSGGTVSLSPSDMIVGSFAQVVWDSLSANFVLLNNPGLEARFNDLSLNVDAAGISLAASITSLDSRITSQSALWTAETASVVASAVSNNSSLSAQITNDIRSASSDIKTDISSVSLVIETRIQSLSATMSTILNTAVAGMVDRLRLPLAWGSFIGNTPSLSTFDGFNFLSVTRSAGKSGKYRIRFQQTLDITKGLAISGNGALTSVYVTDAGIGASIKLECFNQGAASDSDDIYVSFVVYGAGYS